MANTKAEKSSPEQNKAIMQLRNKLNAERQKREDEWRDSKQTMAEKVIGHLAAYSRIKFERNAAMTEDTAILDAELTRFVKTGFKPTNDNLRELAECTITELHRKYGRKNKALMEVLGAVGRVMCHETRTAAFLRDEDRKVAARRIVIKL